MQQIEYLRAPTLSAPLCVERQQRASPPPRSPRACPHDFDAIYIAHGYDDCEVIFRAAPMTVKRWLLERGADRLRAARAEFVDALRIEARKNSRTRKPTDPTNVTVFAAQPAREAANYLRTVRHGGWFVAISGPGEWWVGTRRLPTDDMIAFAVRKGFRSGNS